MTPKAVAMTTYKNFHAGEAHLQAQSGIDTAAYDADVDQPFLPELNSSEVKFVNKRTFSVAASIDEQSRPWASPLIGAPNELFVVKDATTVRVAPRRVDGDPLFDNLDAQGSMGILYINPAIRRRAKSLGTGTVENDGTITYRMHRMFGLCPKYIFKRDHEVSAADTQVGDDPSTSARLDDLDHAQLAATDTVFLASHSTAHGTDPTHRGGPPGFITVLDDATIEMPDYLGNGMFQTLGNLVLDDRVGFMALDFATGRLLQLTGRGSIEHTTAAGVRTDRVLRISIDEVRRSVANIGTWTDREAYPIPA